MTVKEIIDGLKRAKEENPNTTIGEALEQMMKLDLFWWDKFQTEGNVVSANIPQDCIFTVEDVAGVIGCIDNMVRERKIRFLGEDMNYGVSKGRDLERLNTPGVISPIIGSDNKTWRLLSSNYEIINI